MMIQKHLIVKILRSAPAILLMGIILISSNTNVAYADVPYESYSYNFWGDDVRQPHSYLYSHTLEAGDIGTALSYPQDMFYYNKELYIADTNNSRILKLSAEGELLLEITCGADEEDRLNKPQGVFVTPDGTIYAADTDNGRIVEFAPDGSFLREIGRPVTELISEAQVYKPTKLAVDHSGRIYVIAYGINMGLVEFDRNGDFQGFMGAAKVSISTFEYIWKNYFSTKEQRARMETIIPTEYSSIFVDEENFIYATISNLSEEDYMLGADTIRRLNPTGTDVLRRLGKWSIIGDLYSTADADWSVFTDAYATDYGCYFILDSAGGKIFAYDYDGNNLFCFGGAGSRDGTLQNPVALTLSEHEEKMYILDSVRGSILIYDITEYGKHLLNAMRSNYRGDAATANQEWQEVLKANANSELAYIGLGKTYLKSGDYKKAMEYFKLGNSRKYYSKAFYYYRKTQMEHNFGIIMAGIISVIAVIMLLIWVKKIRRWAGEVRCTMSKR
ncbi:sugar lactone lactonase YvrE [Anaerotaenia torta]|uniref:SMP-30/gluconolactonase/LRE family protein n=1 Tax=Anaerotaenia torta TaxID=433293 RepID=UPI003D1E3FEF